MRKFLISAGLLMALAAIGYAADIDRHADFSDPKKPGASQCKAFYGGDDNRTDCADWCQKYLEANQGAACTCNEGKCPEDDKNP